MKANEVVFYFFDKVGIKDKVNKSDISRNIIQAQRLMKTYTSEDIIRVLDYLIDVKGANIFSFGYITKSIDDTLRTLNEIDERKRIKAIVAEQHVVLEQQLRVEDDEIAVNRNKEKFTGSNGKRRIGTKFDFDLLTQ